MSGFLGGLLRNCAVKFAILAARAIGAERPDPGAFLDLTPWAALQRFKSYLDDTQRGIVMFGLSDQAIMDILDTEFDVNMDNYTLVFRKSVLDAESICLAGGGRFAVGQDTLFTPKERILVENLAGWLLEATRSLYKTDLSEGRAQDILNEYAENVRVYVRKCVPNYEPGDAEVFLRSLFASAKAMRAFCHSLTVDAMFKADAAKVIFGDQSAYHQAWFRKQIFRHMMSKAVDEYISTQAVGA